MKTYVINLDKDTDRLEQITARLNRLKMPFIRVAGVVPDGITGTTQPGMYGCAMSHANACRVFLDDEAEDRALILEDDAVLRDDLPERLVDLLQQLEQVEDWDVFYLGVCPAQIGRQVTKNIWELKSGLHTHAYVVNKRGAKKLIDYTNGRTWPRACWDNFPPTIQKYFCDPILAIQQPGFSNVGKIRIDRTGSYFRYFDKGEFFDNCLEAECDFSDRPPKPLPMVVTKPRPDARPIPRRLHQVWVGDKPLPDQFRVYAGTWKAHHPDWEYRLWTDHDLDDCPVRPLAERFASPAARADVYRLWIVNTFGGFYTDTDTECLRPLDDLLADPHDAFVGLENDYSVCNAVFGASANHPWLDWQLERLPFGQPDPWGPKQMTRACRQVPHVRLLPLQVFYPRLNRISADSICVHHWAGSWKA